MELRDVEKANELVVTIRELEHAIARARAENSMIHLDNLTQAARDNVISIAVANYQAQLAQAEKTLKDL